NGLIWLLGQIQIFDEHLLYNESLHPSQRRMALKTLGRRQQDIFIDELALTFTLDAISGCHADPTRLTAGELATTLQPDRPADVPPEEFGRRLGDCLHCLSSPADAQKALRDVLAKHRQKLQSRLEEVTLREQRADQRAAEEARVGATKENM